MKPRTILAIALATLVAMTLWRLHNVSAQTSDVVNRFYRIKTVEWDVPTQNADGTALEDLGGFKLVIVAPGQDPNDPAATILSEYSIDDPLANFYHGVELYRSLSPGLYRVWVAAYDVEGHTSDYVGDLPHDSRRLPPKTPVNVRQTGVVEYRETEYR